MVVIIGVAEIKASSSTTVNCFCKEGKTQPHEVSVETEEWWTITETDLRKLWNSGIQSYSYPLCFVHDDAIKGRVLCIVELGPGSDFAAKAAYSYGDQTIKSSRSLHQHLLMKIIRAKWRIGPHLARVCFHTCLDPCRNALRIESAQCVARVNLVLGPRTLPSWIP